MKVTTIREFDRNMFFVHFFSFFKKENAVILFVARHQVYVGIRETVNKVREKNREKNKKNKER